MNLPNFLCIGAQKAGTTLLYDILKRHPDIYLPDVKELHFFDRDEEYARGLDWYRSQYFSKAGNHRCIGEITPSYIFLENVPERIFKTLGPDLKLIVLLRNPADRAYSHYWMTFRRGLETIPFMDALKREPERMQKDYWGKVRFSYVQRGFYAQQIRRYLNYFPTENMKFVFFEEFIADMPGSIGEIVKFLGCDPDRLSGVESQGKIHSGRLTFFQYVKAIVVNRSYVEMKSLWDRSLDYPQLKLKYQKMVMGYYTEDINALQSLLNKDFSMWMHAGLQPAVK